MSRTRAAPGSGFHVPRSKLPFVFSNFAMTADGKIAFATREFAPFSSERDREHMMELRATADAVMSGARTVETPGVTLGPGRKRFRQMRLARGLSEYNLRVIVSGSSSINPDAAIFQHRFSPIVVLITESAPGEWVRRLNKVATEVKMFGRTQIDFRAALSWLRKKWNVRRLLCEGGGELHGALIRAGLVDELHLTICPTIFGGRTAPTIAEGDGVNALAAARSFRLISTHRIGDELFTILSRSNQGS